MTQEVSGPNQKKIEEIFQISLKTVNKALGIENLNHPLELSESKANLETNLDRVGRRLPDEIDDEEKRYRVERHTQAQAMFAESQAKFTEAQTMFVLRVKRRSSSAPS